MHTGWAENVRLARRTDRGEDIHESIEQFEKDFHQAALPEFEEIAKEELEKEEASIEEQNEAFKEGKSPFSEKLNELSDWTQEQIKAEKEGAIDPNGKIPRFFGLIIPPEEERILSPEAEAYLKSTYERLSRVDLPDSYDARDHGNLNITPASEFFREL